MDSKITKIVNDTGEREMRVATKRFECIGASPPHDHPHIYLEMGDADYITCPYCSTKYIFTAK